MPVGMRIANIISPFSITGYSKNYRNQNLAVVEVPIDRLSRKQPHWTPRYFMRVAMAAGFVAAATIVSAEVRGAPAQQPTREAYEACLSSEATKGTYTAADGGISALHLMDQCAPQLGEWRVDCMASGQTANQCNLLAASYAQAILEQRKHRSKP